MTLPTTSSVHFFKIPTFAASPKRSFHVIGAKGILFQVFYGLMGSWTTYLISILYVEYKTRKEREKVDFRNHVIQVEGVTHSGLAKMMLYFTGATNILYTFGGHAVTVRREKGEGKKLFLAIVARRGKRTESDASGAYWTWQDSVV